MAHDVSIFTIVTGFEVWVMAIKMTTIVQATPWSQIMLPHKTLKERFFQALGFELLAILICAPLAAWIMGVSLVHMGVLTLLVSLIAMLWNMVFNALFDRAQRRLGFERGLAVRLAHAALFELGLVAAVVPLAAWWLGVGLWEALMLDIGILLFFLPYTLGYNWAYDKLRAMVVERRQPVAG
jgi:uncharacterized membrane protein